MDTKAAQLKSALRRKQFVQFYRPFDQSSENGFVMVVGPRWFMLARFEDGVRFSGFQCMKLTDVRKLSVPGPQADFVAKVLKKRRLRIPKPPRVNTATIEKLLASASRAFPLITIHRENVNASVCQIGQVVDITNGEVSLLEMNPDATWDSKPTRYRLSEITRVDFDGEYERVLHLVGEKPKSKRIIK